MNKAILMGRLTRDPEIRYTQGDNPMCIARYTLAVDRRFNRNANNDGNNADFIPCVCFGKTAEFVEKYLKKGTKMAVTGRIQTGSYTNRDGVKVYTTEVVVEDQEFAESRNASGNGNYNGGNSGYNSGSNNGGGSRGGNYGGRAEQAPAQDAGSSDSLDGFMNIPDGIDEELPFA
ncbi:MAG: single-stranded DNA-binding protein [Lachnospiraceae bacterium]|nr:single-stranded DNA-binding protein [Lachnospiraceae bacterium]